MEFELSKLMEWSIGIFLQFCEMQTGGDAF